MSYFENILRHIGETGDCQRFGQCQLFPENDGKRKLQSPDIDPVWINSRPIMIDGYWGFHAKTADMIDPVFLMIDEPTPGRSHPHGTVPGFYEALEKALKDAQAQQIISFDYALGEMSVYSVLLTGEDAPTRLAIKNPAVTDSGKHEIFIFDHMDHTDGCVLVVKPGDTFSMHIGALLALNVAKEGKNIEDKFLEEMAVLFQEIQEKRID